MKERTPEYRKLFYGEKVFKKVIEWENPLGMENIKKGINLGIVIGQFTLDGNCIYWMPKKVKDGT